MTFSINSSAFRHEGAIPRSYTCDGEDRSPPLNWTGAPPKTRSFALIVDDPDAPDPAAPRMTWVHWLVYNLPPACHELASGSERVALPAGALEGRNDWKKRGYGGPCPPIGRHRYFFRLFALDVLLPDLDTPTRADLERAMKGHILAQATLSGTYERD